MKSALAFAGVVILSGSAYAANLDVTSSYKMKAVSYENLDLGADTNNHALLLNDARLGIAVRKIRLDANDAEDSTLDVGLVLHAVGVAGSTSSLASPVNEAAANYPTTNMTPFIENAYLKLSRLFGMPVESTIGRQTYRLGSGLLLDDDGAGFNGVTLRGEFPWQGLRGEAFVFQDKNPQALSASSSLTLFGLSLAIPTEGTWEVNELVENDHSDQLVYGCTYAGDPDLAGCRVSRALRSFSSARYQINFGPMVFDGEAAMEKGVATPTGATPAPNHITYNANAQVVKMKWKQSLYKTGEGIARVSVARGSGDDTSTATSDEAFFPSHGHRFSGLERSGFGSFYSATPYDAYGGNYSTSTKSGLPNGASGLIVVGAGYTPPAFWGFNLDLDYYLYQAERIANGSRTLGNEWDLGIRYPIKDQVNIALGLAYFKSGLVTDPNASIARKYSFEASARF